MSGSLQYLRFLRANYWIMGLLGCIVIGSMLLSVVDGNVFLVGISTAIIGSVVFGFGYQRQLIQEKTQLTDEELEDLGVPSLQSLSGLSDRTIDVYVISHEKPTGFASIDKDGYFLVLTDTLLSCDEEVVLGIIAHELAHIHFDSHRFFPQRFQHGFAILGLYSIVAGGLVMQSPAYTLGLLSVACVLLFAYLVVSSYQSRVEEYACDEFALEMTSKPVMSRALCKLYDAGASDESGLFATHPPISDRIKRLNL